MSSTGITHQIRLKLNFNDEKVWKKFSSRRLELIDAMKLSQKKASEQDNEILNCSKILMNEFNYNAECYLQDFIKLVRVAIQSVRRNRKRSTKSKNGSLKNGNKFVMVKSPYYSDDDFTDVLKTDEANDYSYQTQGNAPTTNSPASSRLPINSLLQPVLPRSKNSFTKLPSFASLLVEDEFGLQSPQSQEQLQQEPQHFLSNKELIALNKLLSLIKKSKTCSDLALDLQNSSNNATISSSFYENLEMLGSTIILSTISYIFEKFFINLNPSSISYLRLKLNNDFTLSKILKNLDLSLNEYYYNDFIAAQTFKRLIGCCIKDFGFDTVISPLTDIIHEIILRDYPLISKNSSILNNKKQQQAPSPTLSNAPLTIPSPTASVITTASMSHQPHRFKERRYSNELISVELKFNSTYLNFKFNPKTSSKPTFLELLENSKDAFNIPTTKYVFLKNLKNLELIKNDDDVLKIFNNCLDGIIKIGIFVTGSSPAPQLPPPPPPSSSHQLVTIPVLPITQALLQQVPQQPQPQKRESLLDTLSNAAEIVESRSKENSEPEISALPEPSSPKPRESSVINDIKTTTTNDSKIVFQPLL